MSKHAFSFGLIALSLAACTANVDARGTQIGNGATIGGKTDKADTTKAKDSVKAIASSKTPPSGAVSKGMQSSPKFGATTIPFESAEVYVVEMNIDDDGDMEEVFWAVSGDYVYVWAAATVDCADGVGKGEEQIVLEQHGDAYGWLVSGDGCGWTNTYGCSSADGATEVCGGCAWTDAAIVCTASSN
jgi:hypothetical protein